MIHQGTTEVDGQVKEALPNANFRVMLESGKTILCYVSGKMRINHIRIMPGDRVKAEITPYDESKGRIVYRY